MKSYRPRLIVLLATAALPVALFAQTPAEKPVAKTEKRTLRVISGPERQGPKESVTFLGVETALVNDTLSAQLGLAKGTGLVVRSVVPDSPANGVIQQHDILLKLDDQVLIEVRQLSVLIRGRKAGDEVALQLLRGGQSQTVKVKLVQREMPALPARGPMPEMEWFEHSGRGGAAIAPHARAFHGVDPERMREVLGVIDDARTAGPRVHVFERRVAGDGAKEVTIVNPANSRVVFTDDEGSLEVSHKDGKKSLVAKGPDGAVIYDGAIDTAAQREKLPASVRARLEQVEKMKEFSFTPDGALEGVRLHAPAPSADRIALPMRPIAPGHPAVPARPAPAI